MTSNVSKALQASLDERLVEDEAPASKQRTNIYMTTEQKRDLQMFKRVTGLSVAEHARRAIDNYIAKMRRTLRRNNDEGQAT